jgi:hypothetical protein
VSPQDWKEKMNRQFPDLENRPQSFPNVGYGNHLVDPSNLETSQKGAKPG